MSSFETDETQQVLWDTLSIVLNLWKLLRFSSRSDPGMLSSSDEESQVVVDASSARQRKRYQFLAEDMVEVNEGDFLAVKPGSPKSLRIVSSFLVQRTNQKDLSGCAGS